MAYPAAAIANEFLNLAEQDGVWLTQMQLQKLVYFAHGWHLAFTTEPLVNERLLAWDYGPVVKSLWRAFKEFGSKPITKKASVPDWQGAEFRWITPCIDDSNDADVNAYTRALVRRIWEEYGHLQAFQLSELTHLQGSPWQLARSQDLEFIRDSDIEEYFRKSESEEHDLNDQVVATA